MKMSYYNKTQNLTQLKQFYFPLNSTLEIVISLGVKVFPSLGMTKYILPVCLNLTVFEITPTTFLHSQLLHYV